MPTCFVGDWHVVAVIENGKRSEISSPSVMTVERNGSLCFSPQPVFEELPPSTTFRINSSGVLTMHDHSGERIRLGHLSPRIRSEELHMVKVAGKHEFVFERVDGVEQPAEELQSESALSD